MIQSELKVRREVKDKCNEIFEQYQMSGMQSDGE